MPKIDFTDLTFNIPVRIDSEDRSFNIGYIIDYLVHNFETKIIVYENGPSRLFENKHNVQYVYENNSGPFHRTRYLNEMAKISTTKFIANYDCDVIFPINQMLYAHDILVTDQADFVYPYDGLFVNIDKQVLNLVENYNPMNLDPTKYHNFGNQSVGGAIFWNKQVFVSGGMENQNLISWGCEDWERLRRFTKLGYRPGRVRGPLYHIEHSRTQDSNESNPRYQHNVQVFQYIDSLDKQQITEHIKTWPWLL